MFTLYPAIDLIGNRCVRLTQGDFAQQNTYTIKPEQLAINYRQAGSEWLHLIDLEAAQSQGKQQQWDIIQDIVRTSQLKIQCGGGIHRHNQLQRMFAAGIKRVIVGSLCVQNPNVINQWLDEFSPENIVLALDIKYQNGEPYVAIHGWQELSKKKLWQLLDQFPTAKHVLCTDISKDGTLQGPNFGLYQDIHQRFPQIQVQASGGIATFNDILQLKQNGSAGAVLGKALLENRFHLKDAIQKI